jgi:hypothetical protein
MRKDSLEIISKYLFAPQSETQSLTDNEKDQLSKLADCYNQRLQNPWMSRGQLRDYLVRRNPGMSAMQAYRIMDVVNVHLGNVTSSAKEWVKLRIESLLEEAHQAVQAKNYEKAKALTKIADVYGRTFRTDSDDSALMNAAQYLEIEKVEITLDPKVIGIQISEPERKHVEELKRKYGIAQDTAFEEITTDE